MFDHDLADTIATIRTARDILAETAAQLREINDILDRQVMQQ